MSKYRKIHCLIWHDQKFPFLDDGAQLVFFHAYTSTFSNGLGLMVVSIEALAASKRWPVETYQERFLNLSQAGICYYDARFQTVYFPNFLKYNRPDNPNSLKGALKTWDELPDCPHKFQLWERLQELATEWGRHFLEVVETLPKPSRNVQETFPEPMLNNREQRTENREQTKSKAGASLRPGSGGQEDSPAGDEPPPVPEANPSTPLALVTPERSDLAIAVMLKSGELYWIHDDEIAKLEGDYPDVRVRHELRKLAKWNKNNPRRRKTRTGMGRHISAWLDGAEQQTPASRQDSEGRYIKPRNTIEEAHNARINLKRERGESSRVVTRNDDDQLRGVVHQQGSVD